MGSELFRFFASLKLAVFCLLTLAAVLATATGLESLYGMRAAHIMVYGTWWFTGLLFLLGSNVLCAALSRYPWKKHQTGFVITHAGILTILFGSLATRQFGVDGNLPVFEKNEDNDVILNELVLAIYDENGSLLEQFPVPESGKSRSGHLMEVAFQPGTKLVVDQFLPRAVPQRVVKASPLAGVGASALKVELFNSRFRVEQWLINNQPKASEVSMGPAVLSLQKLWNQDETDKFLKEDLKGKVASKEQGLLVVNFEGREFRVNIDDKTKDWTHLGSSPLELRVERYLPYAIVENNKLVSKSNDPVNPALQLLIRDTEGNAEEHTVFANFPEFNTLQKVHRETMKKDLGLKFRFLASGKGPEEKLSIVGNQRGKLKFALSADNSKLFYRVAGASGNVNASGEVQVGKVESTGWMDLKFKVSEWFPAAVEEEVPHYVEFIQGSENFLTGIHLSLQDTRNPAAQSDGMWLMEGAARNVPVGGRQFTVQYTKQKLLLPFAIKLEKFTIGTDPGTTKAATYQSQVIVKDNAHGTAKPATISMNEPMKYGGYTFYQASYQLEEGRPPMSVFAVNYDPGRLIKYIGSIIMTLGILIMFYMNPHYLGKMLGRRKESAA